MPVTTFSHLCLDLTNFLPVWSKLLKPYLHFCTPPYVLHSPLIIFPFILSTLFCFAKWTKHQFPLYINLSILFYFFPLTAKLSPSLILQCCSLCLLQVYSEENTTAVGTTELEINKSYKCDSNCIT